MTENLISESTTLEEFDKRLHDFRNSLYGRCPRDADSNFAYLAWSDGVAFGKKHTLRLVKEGFEQQLLQSQATIAELQRIVPPAQPQRSDLPRPFAKPIKDGDPVIDLKGIRNPPTPDQPRDCGEWTWKKHPTIVRGEFTCVISYGEQVIASLEFESDAKRICDAHNAALAAKPLKTYERHLLEQELAAEREQCKAIVEHCTEEGRKLEREVWEAAVKNRRLPEPQCNVPKSKKKFMNGKQKIYTRPCYGGKWLEIHIGKRRFILSYSDVMKLKRTLDKELEEADAIIERR